MDLSAAVHVVPAREMILPGYILPSPDVTESDKSDQFRVPSLDALVRMKLTSFRGKDQVHLQGMLEVRLIDSTWKARLPGELAERLQELFDTPEG